MPIPNPTQASKATRFFVVATMQLAGSAGCELATYGIARFDEAGVGDAARPDGAVPEDGGAGDAACPSRCSDDGSSVLDCGGTMLFSCGNASCAAGACTWSPDKLGTVALWLRADKGLTGSPVSSWEDQSGKGHVAGQLTPSWQPTRVDDFGAKKRPALRFDADDQLVGGTSVIATSHGAYAVLAVARAQNGPLGTIYTSRTTFPCSASMFQVDPSNGNRIRVHADGLNVGTNNHLENDIRSVLREPFASVHRYLSVGAPQVFVNGTAQPLFAGGAAQANESGTQGFTVGAMDGTVFFDGDIAEIVVVDGAIADAVVTQFQDYARARYGL